MSEIVERTAKLFEAGNYADKGITVTEEDLDNLIGSFTQAPVKVEHQDTPFDGCLGVLKRIWREGKELFGAIGFSSYAWEFIDRAGARRLSIALAKDKSAIKEVSLVRSPRVASAQVFDDRVELFSSLPESVSAEKTAEDFARLQEENERLQNQLRSREVDSLVLQFKRSGKLIPAVEDFARAILTYGHSGSIKFDGETTSVALLFGRFLENMPCIVEFTEQAQGRDMETHISEEQSSIFKRLGVDPASARKYLD